MYIAPKGEPTKDCIYLSLDAYHNCIDTVYLSYI